MLSAIEMEVFSKKKSNKTTCSCIQECNCCETQVQHSNSAVWYARERGKNVGRCKTETADMKKSFRHFNSTSLTLIRIHHVYSGLGNHFYACRNVWMCHINIHILHSSANIVVALVEKGKKMLHSFLSLFAWLFAHSRHGRFSLSPQRNETEPLSLGTRREVIECWVGNENIWTFFTGDWIFDANKLFIEKSKTFSCILKHRETMQNLTKRSNCWKMERIEKQQKHARLSSSHSSILQSTINSIADEVTYCSLFHIPSEAATLQMRTRWKRENEW